MRILAFWTALALAVCVSAGAQAEVLALRRVGLTVADLDRTERFYRDVLDFRPVSRGIVPSEAPLLGLPDTRVEVLTMRLGAEEVEFLRFDPPGRPYPDDTQGPDRWFQHFAIVVSDMDAAYARLRGAGVQAISHGGPQTLPERNGHVRAFKFRDPDGHPLELLSFPGEQGRAVWHERPELFLGIDHSAISIADTGASLAFYRDVLGLRVTNAGVNDGPTQAQLDGIAGPVVRITSLRPAGSDGPGIEFLDYRTPSTGRPVLADTRADDVTHAHLTLAVDGLEIVWNNPAARRVSVRPTAIAPGICAVTIRDPDGHSLVLERQLSVSSAEECS
jgi:catechol 2,3-dioxygenase-like lactoylglutathione lyase family enzyme